MVEKFETLKSRTVKECNKAEKSGICDRRLRVSCVVEWGVEERKNSKNANKKRNC